MNRSRPAILAVDGGDSKADVVLLDRSGNVLGARRSYGSSHFGLDGRGSFERLEKAIRLTCKDGDIEFDHLPVAAVGVFCLAGADLALDDRRIAKEVTKRAWTRRTIIRNDTFAVLRAGTDRGWGIAVVCGAGMNCAGIGPDGREVRFPAFGELSGDRAHGGGWLGRAALGAAVRARDGRGPRTMLERLVPQHFGMSRPSDVMVAVYVGRLDARRMLELPPIVFRAAAGGDEVSQNLIDQLGDEVVADASAAIRRLRVTSRDVEVVLGGGLFRSGDARLLGRIREGVAAVAPRAVVRRLDSPPALGAALIGLDEIHASAEAKARLRATLTDDRLRAGRPLSA